MIRCLILASSAILGLGGWLQAQSTEGALGAKLAAEVRSAERRGMTVGLLATDLDSGKVLIAHRAREPRIPASVQKVLTVSATLLGPGAGHQILTDLIGHGSRDGERFDGSLRLRGEGDPTLSARVSLAEIADAVLATGLRHVTGDLLVDDRLFKGPRQARDWPKADPATKWMAGAAALSLDRGTALLVIEGEAKPKVRVVPEGTSLKVQSALEWSPQGKRVVRLETPAASSRYDLVIRGRTPQRAGEAHAAAIRDPALFFGQALAAALRNRGLTIDGEVRRPKKGELTQGGKLVHRRRTPAVELFDRVLKNSDNHYAEMLFAHLGAAHSGTMSFKTGRTAAAEHIAALEIPTKQQTIIDGSGLSRANRLTPRFLVRLFAGLRRAGHLSALEAHMAYGGESGTTLRSRLKEIGRNVRAKTGTLNGVKALAGTLTLSSGRKIGFAILLEGGGSGARRLLQDKIVRELNRWSGP